jgi:hypothetical protein
VPACRRKSGDEGQTLEPAILGQRASNNTKEQFSNSTDLANKLMNAILHAFDTHTTTSKPAIDSRKVRHGIKDIQLGPAQLYEALWGGGGKQRYNGTAASVVIHFVLALPPKCYKKCTHWPVRPKKDHARLVKKSRKRRVRCHVRAESGPLHWLHCLQEHEAAQQTDRSGVDRP